MYLSTSLIKYILKIVFYIYFIFKGIHPTTISESFQRAAVKACEILEGMMTPLELSDRESLLKSASTALNSKVIVAFVC